MGQLASIGLVIKAVITEQSLESVVRVPVQAASDPDPSSLPVQRVSLGVQVWNWPSQLVRSAYVSSLQLPTTAALNSQKLDSTAQADSSALRVQASPGTCGE